MFKKEVKRKWLVDLNKIDNINNYRYDFIKYGCLSQEYDSLNVSVVSINDKVFNLIVRDSGLKVRNKITYNISVDEFNLSILLSGSKKLEKRRYYIPSSFDKERIIYLDIFNDYDFIIAEYESDTELMVDTLIDEDWFMKEITDNVDFYSHKIVYKKKD